MTQELEQKKGLNAGLEQKQDKSGGASVEAQKYDQYVGMCAASGYQLDESVGNVNVIGIQGWMDGKVVENVKNKYNDSIIAVYQERDANGNVVKKCAEFLASVDPGTYANVNAKGSANLQFGQHKYKAGTHKGYAAFNPDEKSRVWRDKNNNGKRDSNDTEESGYFGINIHAAGDARYGVNNWSEGCQVIASKDGTKGANNSEFIRFRDIIMQKDTDKKFVYTLLSGCLAKEKYDKAGGKPVIPAAEDPASSEPAAPQNSAPASVSLTSAQIESAITYNKKNNQSIAKKIQALVGTTADGVFGKNTVKAIAAWQLANSLTPDGKFGAASKAKANFDVGAQKPAEKPQQSAQNAVPQEGGSHSGVSEAGMACIKQFESCELKSYLCPAGIWTIGWGNTQYADGSKVKAGQTITQKEADELFLKVVNDFAVGVEALVKVKLSQNQFDALVSFSYNVGLGNFKSSTLLRLLNQGDYAGAAEQFARWNKGGGKVLQGLVRRREAETALFKGV